jgi:hypothetical protein
MKKISFFVLLCVATTIGTCQQSTKRRAIPKPDAGNYAHNTYRNDFFGLSYPLPKDWHKSTASPSPLPSGAYYLFIGDRDTGRPLLSRVTLVADPESSNSPGLSTQEYLSAFIGAQISQAHAEVTRQPFSLSLGGRDFYRVDYKWVNNGTMLYSSMVCAERNSYWLAWSFVAPSQQDLDDALSTLQHISFDNPEPRSR